MTTGPLVVGYGNVLRGDDGIGWHAADLIAADPRLAGVHVLQRHQLLPELAVEISEASLVVLVDASRDLPAGAVTVTVVDPDSAAATKWSHHLTPPSLVALAQELFGHAPEVFLVSAGVDRVEVGDTLSPAVSGSLPRVLDTVAGLVAGRPAGPGTEPAAEVCHA